MTKFLFTAFTILSLSTLNAQQLKSNLSLGLPVGDVSEGYNLNVNLEFVYLWEITNQVQLGVASGYSHFVGDSFEAQGLKLKVDDAGFLPLTATLRFNATAKTSLSMNFGYAFGLSPEGNSGGFTYAPKMYYNFNNALDLYISYKGIRVDDTAFSSICFGVEFNL